MTQTLTTYIVQTAADQNRASWKWQHPRRRVAVIEVDVGLESVSMISQRARGCHRVVETWECCYVGSTPRCQYEVALAAAEELADRLNADRDRQEIAAELQEQIELLAA